MSVNEREKGTGGAGSRHPPAGKAPTRRERDAGQQLGTVGSTWRQRRRGRGNEEKQNKRRREENLTGDGSGSDRWRQWCDGGGEGCVWGSLKRGVREGEGER